MWNKFLPEPQSLLESKFQPRDTKARSFTNPSTYHSPKLFTLVITPSFTPPKKTPICKNISVRIH
jgi:hypothetical protein